MICMAEWWRRYYITHVPPYTPYIGIKYLPVCFTCDRFDMPSFILHISFFINTQRSFGNALASRNRIFNFRCSSGIHLNHFKWIRIRKQKYSSYLYSSVFSSFLSPSFHSPLFICYLYVGLMAVNGFFNLPLSCVVLSCSCIVSCLRLSSQFPKFHRWMWHIFGIRLVV